MGKKNIIIYVFLSLLLIVLFIFREKVKQFINALIEYFKGIFTKQSETSQNQNSMQTEIKIKEVTETPEQYNKRTGRKVKDVLTVQAKNPGAIFWFGDKWQGLDDQKSVNGKIAYFKEVSYGARAQIITLLNYQRKHLLMTPAGIINRYAPSNVHNNNTQNYIDFVCKEMGITSTTYVNFDSNPESLAKFAYFQHIVEAGFAWVDYKDYLKIANENALSGGF